MIISICLPEELKCAKMESRILKRKRDFAVDSGISDVRTRGVTIFSLRPQRDFGTLAVLKRCFVRHAVIRLRLSRASSRIMMRGRLSFDTGALNVRPVLKEPWSGSVNTAQVATHTKTSISRSPMPFRKECLADRKPRCNLTALKRLTLDPALGHASFATLYTLFWVYHPLDHTLSS